MVVSSANQVPFHGRWTCLSYFKFDFSTTLFITDPPNRALDPLTGSPCRAKARSVSCVQFDAPQPPLPLGRVVGRKNRTPDLLLSKVFVHTITLDDPMSCPR